MFSKKVSLKDLIEHCRSMRHLLETGITIAQAMRMQARNGPPGIKPIALRMAGKLEEGQSFVASLKEESDYFHPLFLTIGSVGEKTGQLPEVFKELEEYFTFQLKLKREFISQITWPVVQFIAATLVVSLVIYLLGIINNGSHGLKVLGLQGPTGASIFFFSCWGTVAAIGAFIFFLRKAVGRGEAVDRFFLRLYALGPCLRSLALSRFSKAMSMMMEAGVRLVECVGKSLDATGNFAFMGRSKVARTIIKDGGSLTEALTEHGLFPEEFLRIVESAEVGGKEPDTFRRQADFYDEDSRIKIKFLTAVASRLVWLLVAIFIIVLIFNIFSQYIAAINQHL